MPRAIHTDASIMIVDDELSNVRVLERVLASAGYRRITGMTDPAAAVARFAELEPDLLVLDLHMPEMDGVAVTERVRAELPADEYLPILILTGDTSHAACRRTLAMGATDFVSKPFDVHEVLFRIRNLLEIRFLYRQIARSNQDLERRVRERTIELEASQLDTIERLALAAEFRDDDTGRHTQRVGELSELLARALGWSDAEATLLRRAAPLHDVGKIGIADSILCKPGPLTLRQQKTMRSHTTIGAKILSGGRSKFIRLAEGIAHAHHERWDGNGYPQQLSGEGITASARVVAVADFFDATAHDRVYRKAWPPEKVFATIAEMSGQAFDPAVAALCGQSEVRDAMLAVTGPSPTGPWRSPSRGAGGRSRDSGPSRAQEGSPQPSAGLTARRATS